MPKIFVNSTHPHAVLSVTGKSFVYDQNGSLTSKVVYGAAYLFSYDAENRLTGVSGKTTAAFTYDGDSKRVQSVIGGTTTSFVGSYFEWTGSTSSMKKYYYAGSGRQHYRRGVSPVKRGIKSPKKRDAKVHFFAMKMSTAIL